jgi:hypothetical protein
VGAAGCFVLHESKEIIVAATKARLKNLNAFVVIVLNVFDE